VHEKQRREDDFREARDIRGNLEPVGNRLENLQCFPQLQNPQDLEEFERLEHPDEAEAPAILRSVIARKAFLNRLILEKRNRHGCDAVE